MSLKSVVLINPPLSLEDRYGKDMKNFGAVTEPLGIAYIASYLESQKIAVRIVDAPALKMTLSDTVKNIVESNDDIVGITMLTPAFGIVKSLCDAIKKERPNKLIIIGGAHPTAMPERTLQEIQTADVVCIGEGELTLYEIASISDKGLDNFSKIQGISFRYEGKIVTTEKRPFIKDLDIIPPPARHLLPMAKYHLTASRTGGSSYCPTIIVARGCPFSCTYCSKIFGRTFRSHSIDRILNEIEFLIKTYNISQLNIEADTLTANKKFLKELCNKFIDKGINKKISWTCESRVDTVDEDILTLMKKAGCWQISYGVETGNQRLLDTINKSVTLKQVEEIFRLTKKVGISIRGFFMLGLPTETPQESLETIKFAKKLNPLWAQFTLTVPYPGTKMFNELDAKGLIKNYNWSDYNTWSGWKGQTSLPYISQGRTAEELVKLQKSALRQFYLRPSVVWRFILNIKSLDDVKKYFQGFIVLIKSKIQS